MSKENQMLEELVKIREALVPPPPEKPKEKKSILQQFKDFLNKYKVLGLAVAFIMGQYLGDLVQSLVNNLVMPLITVFLPSSIPWEEFELWVFRIGAFIGDLITFIIVAFVIFLLIKYTAKLGID
ncbi:MAG: MscL family protein [Promethearchaeota archaeon]